MSDDDLVLYLVFHGLKHGFSRLIWILDVAMALKGLRNCSFGELMRRAQLQDWSHFCSLVARLSAPCSPSICRQRWMLLSPHRLQPQSERPRPQRGFFAEDPKDVI